MEENYPLAKWLNDELTEAELEAFRQEPDYGLYQKIREFSSELTTSGYDEQQLLDQILSTKKAQPKTISMYSAWWMKVAAILVLALGMYFAFIAFSAETQTAVNGQQTAFLLPDNSEVLLNSGSEITYKNWNWDSNRNLQLTGEAYFRVAKGKKFQVITGLGKVTVLGTQFNVKARNNRFDVSCFEGRVKVNYQNQQVIITKGQTVAFADHQKIISQTISDTKPQWTLRQMAFEKAGLSDVFDEIERVYDITIDSGNLQSVQLFSGKLPSDNIDIALQVIASTYHLKINKTAAKHYALEPLK